MALDSLEVGTYSDELVLLSTEAGVELGRSDAVSKGSQAEDSLADNVIASRLDEVLSTVDERVLELTASDADKELSEEEISLAKGMIVSETEIDMSMVEEGNV